MRFSPPSHQNITLPRLPKASDNAFGARAASADPERSFKPEPEPNKPSDSHVAARARVVPLRRARVFFGVKSSCVTINKKNSLETFPKTKLKNK